MRLTILIVASAAAFGLCASPAVAQFAGQSFLGGRIDIDQGPWCAHSNTGADRVEEDCSFASFEACNREARLNRGYCTQNFSGSVRPVRTHKGNRNRR